MKTFWRLLFPFLLAVPVSGQTSMLLPRTLTDAIRNIPADSATAFCVLRDTLVFRGDTALYVVDATYEATRSVMPKCSGTAVILVRPPCVFLAEEVPEITNNAAWATTVLLCGPRDSNRRPSVFHILRQTKQPQRGKIA